MPLFACQNEIPVLTSCPPLGSQVLLFNVTGPTQYKGMALMDLAMLKCCWMYEMFGIGIATITGADLVVGLYENTGLVQDLLVYAWSIPNLLIRGPQWDYVYDDNGKVAGIEIKINYAPEDRFTIWPNPSCTGTPAAALPGTINERWPLTGYIDGVDDYDLDWTPARKAKYGPFGNFVVWMDDGSGVYNPTGIQPIPNDIDNPTIFSFSGLGTNRFFIVIG